MGSLVDSEAKKKQSRGRITRNLHKHEATSSAEESQSHTESKTTEWTNEKHSLYLRSMETSFVNQLYDSMDSFGWNSQNKCSSNPKTSKQKNSASSQFKVFRDGSWTKIDVKSGEPRLCSKKEAGPFLASPWIKRYRPCRHHIETSLDQQEETPIPAMVNCCPVSQLTLHQDSVDSITEVTDQNFVDEDHEGEMSKRTQSMRRIKTSLVSDSSTDQVVPFDSHPSAGDGIEVHSHLRLVIGNQ